MGNAKCSICSLNETGSVLRIIIYKLIHISWISKRELVTSLIFTVNLATDKLLVTSY